MAHGNNILHSIKLPNGSTYEIHDAHAVHTLEDMMNLGLSGAFIFKGTKATVAELPTSGNTVGDVWHVTANDSEYVWTDGGEWEEFGAHITVDHKHTIDMKGTNASSAVTGTATVTGGNSASTVSGTASIANAPSVSATPVYAKVSTGNADFVTSYPGATSKLVTTSITPAGTATNVINSVTPSTGSVTGVSGSTTASKATAGTAVAVAKPGTPVTVATRASSQTTVGNANVGTAVTVATNVTGGSVADWHAEVNSGVLEFSFTPNTLQSATTTSITPAATSTTKIYGCGDTTSVTPAVSNGNITPYTFADVTVPKAATAATTVVTGIETGETSVATVGTAKTVATGALASNGAGSAVMTGLGTAVTAKALTSASLAAGTSTDGIHTGDDVTITTQTLSGTISGTAAAQTWTQNTGSISGTAAAQKWTQGETTVSNPV